MIDIGVCVSSAIDKVKQNPHFYLVGSGIICGVGFVLWFAAYIMGSMWGVVASNLKLPLFVAHIVTNVGSGLIGTVVGALIVPFLVGFFRGIKKEYEGEKAEYEELFSAFDVFAPALINYGVAQLVMFVGFMLCVVPGILVAPLASLTAIYLASGVTDGFEPLKKAVELLKRNPIVILWNIVLGLLVMVGMLVCCVGVVVTLPIGLYAYYVMFRQVTGTTDVAPQSDVAVPPSASIAS